MQQLNDDDGDDGDCDVMTVVVAATKSRASLAVLEVHSH